MSHCQCYQIGGPFIAEDPECPQHGREAQLVSDRRDAISEQLQDALDSGCHIRIQEAARFALDFLQSQ